MFLFFTDYDSIIIIYNILYKYIYYIYDPVFVRNRGKSPFLVKNNIQTNDLQEMVTLFIMIAVNHQ
jgi:hypothetical protein